MRGAFNELEKRLKKIMTADEYAALSPPHTNFKSKSEHGLLRAILLSVSKMLGKGNRDARVNKGKHFQRLRLEAVKLAKKNTVNTSSSKTSCIGTRGDYSMCVRAQARRRGVRARARVGGGN